MGLAEELKRYGEGDVYPLHMPGHKRNGAWLTMGNPYEMDITEIDGFDDLHEPEGILREGMERAARLYGAEESWYLVDGSTAGILAGVTACTRPGDSVLVARNCHRSVYNALILNRLRPVYLYPPMEPSWGIAGSIPPEEVERTLAEARGEIRLVVVTSPTYEGVISDIRAIAGICHRRGAVLMVDEAHGAHLGFGFGFPAGALAGGADLVVQSLHKTLPAFTQTGLLHRQGSLVSGRRVKRALDVFQSSSPSYLLMAGIDRCLNLLEPEKRGWMADWERRLADFRDRTAGLEVLRILPDSPRFYARDPSKLVISVRDSGRTGRELMEILRREYRFELEMAAADYCIAMTGAGDDAGQIRRFAESLAEIDRRWKTEREERRCRRMDGRDTAQQGERSGGRAKTVLLPWQAEEEDGVPVPLDASALGRTALEFVYAYPPGIPLLVPGEEITEEVLAAAESCRAAGISLRGTYENEVIRVREDSF